jgi:hypothetical protein
MILRPLVDERVINPNRIAFIDIVINALRKELALLAISYDIGHYRSPRYLPIRRIFKGIVTQPEIAIPTSSRGSRRFGIAEPWVSSALLSAAQSLLIQFDVVPLEQIGQLGVFK